MPNSFFLTCFIIASRKISIRNSSGGRTYSKLRKKYISILLGINAIEEIIDFFFCKGASSGFILNP
jgi:hypothetical protein